MTATDKIFTRCMNAGFTREAACALLANLQAESNFISTNLEDQFEKKLGMNDQTYTKLTDSGSYPNFVTDGCGYGLAQWTWWTRKQDLLAFAQNLGVSIGDFDMQCDFLIKELSKSFGSIFKDCCNSIDLQHLTKRLLYEWENPDMKESKLVYRYELAKNWYQKYKDWNGSDEETKESGKMTKEQAIKKVLDLARSEIGYHEQGDNWTKYAQELDRTNWYNGGKNGYAWCDVYVDWLFYKCFGNQLGREMICQPTGSAGAGCLYSAQYYKSAGQWSVSPQPGDQIFFTYQPGEYSHTGIVEKVENGIVTTIEGNTSDSVARRTYQMGDGTIAGYGRPRWELATGASNIPVSGGSGSSSGLDRVLKKGVKGEDVREMQKMLIQLGYEELLQPDGADGDFGNQTYNAVIQFQSEQGLYLDGEVGDETYEKMKELTKNPDAAKPQENQNGSQVLDDEDQPLPVGVGLLKNGAKGNRVKLAQAALCCHGVSASIDGIFGDSFEKKVKNFQKEHGLKADGEIGEETWKKLLEIPYQE